MHAVQVCLRAGVQEFDTLFFMLSTLDNNDSMIDKNKIMTVKS